MIDHVMDDSIFSAAALRSLHSRLLAWFASAARQLPWRGTSDLYRIWISEIMLQQTQVATVVGYFERFVARFPDVKSLAAADEHEVLRLWEGLGYYRRARQLHAAARQIVANHEGEVPGTYAEVLALPGIGRYTAGAILSIGRDERLPILEANTIRVLSRLTAFRGDAASQVGQAFLWQTAEKLLPESQVGNFNQALMELGATICTPRDPACLLCPIRELCPTRRLGLQDKVPAPKKPKNFEEVNEAAVVLSRRDGRILLRQHPPGERWAGLWDFPRFPVRRSGLALTPARKDEIYERAHELTGQTAQNLTCLTVIKHGVTRFRITLYVLAASVVRIKPLPGDAHFAWVRPGELADRALSTTGRKIARMLLPTSQNAR